MVTFDNGKLSQYMESDWLLKLLKENILQGEEKIRTNQWLIDMECKRCIYSEVYGDILRHPCEKRILDVGGGYNSLTKILAANSRYTLLDFMAHGGDKWLSERYKDYHIDWINADWNEISMNDEYDLIIANDIFPDVDQRIELFIDKMLTMCRELRLVVTYYNKPKFYTTKRVDDSEIMTFLSWDGEITALKLSKYLNRMKDTSYEDLAKMKDNVDSIFNNGRQVSYIILRGDME